MDPPCDCAENEICQLGVCVPHSPAPIALECTVDDDCGHKEVCALYVDYFYENM